MANFKDTRTIFSAATLTGSFVTQTSPAYVETYGVDQLVLDVGYTMGAAESGNSIEVKIEFANPKAGLPVTADWVRQTSEATTTGTTTLYQQTYTFAAVSAAATFDYFQIQCPISSKYFRVSVKETGIAANGGTVNMKATLRSFESHTA